MWDDVEKRSCANRDECVTRGDLVRFAQVKALTAGRSESALSSKADVTVSSGQGNVALPTVTPFERRIAAALESEWATFVEYCRGSDSDTGVRHRLPEGEVGNGEGTGGGDEPRRILHVEALERFFATRVTHCALRNSSFITEALLSLCIPTMTAMLEDDAAVALSRVTGVRYRIAHLHDESPWKELLSAARLELNRHAAVCEQLLLERGTSAAYNSDRIDDALRRLMELEAAESDLNARLAASAESLEEGELVEAMSHLLVAESRLVQHLRCRALGSSVMQHLPSFECSTTSDHNNDSFRPVQSALLFTAAELQSRRLADDQRTHAAATRQPHSTAPPSGTDEVSVLQTLLRRAMRRTAVRRADFDRIVAKLHSL